MADFTPRIRDLAGLRQQVSPVPILPSGRRKGLEMVQNMTLSMTSLCFTTRSQFLSQSVNFGGSPQFQTVVSKTNVIVRPICHTCIRGSMQVPTLLHPCRQLQTGPGESQLAIHPGSCCPQQFVLVTQKRRPSTRLGTVIEMRIRS